VGVIYFGLVMNVSIAYTIHPFYIVNTFPVLNVHGYTLQAIGNFCANRITVYTPKLLEISELGYFHTIQPNFPT
jgi:hypothetical protein